MPSGGRINVDESMRVAKGDFDFIDEIDYGEFGAGMCAEGHPIRYGHEFRSPSTGESVILGGECQWKVYLFRMWNNLQAEDITPELIKIGKLFWKIQKDNYWDDVKDLIRQSGVALDLSTIPRPASQEPYRLRLRDFLSKAIARRKARAKAEAARRERERAEKMRAQRRAEEMRLRKREGMPTEVSLLNTIRCPMTTSCDDEKVRKSLVESYIQYGRWTEAQKGLASNLVKKCNDIDYVNICECTCSPRDEQIKRSLIIARRKGDWSAEQKKAAKQMVERSKPRAQEEDFESKKELILAVIRIISNSSANEKERHFLINMHDLIDDDALLSPNQAGWLVGILDTFNNRTKALTFDTHAFVNSITRT